MIITTTFAHSVAILIYLPIAHKTFPISVAFICSITSNGCSCNCNVYIILNNASNFFGNFAQDHNMFAISCGFQRIDLLPVN